MSGTHAQAAELGIEEADKEESPGNLSQKQGSASKAPEPAEALVEENELRGEHSRNPSKISSNISPVQQVGNLAGEGIPSEFKQTFEEGK